jgi:hypothetical protein
MKKQPLVAPVCPAHFRRMTPLPRKKIWKRGKYVNEPVQRWRCTVPACRYCETTEDPQPAQKAARPYRRRRVKSDGWLPAGW